MKRKFSDTLQKLGEYLFTVKSEESAADNEGATIKPQDDYNQYIMEAMAGNAQAQVAVGKYCIFNCEYDEGIEWLKKAEMQDEVTAYTELGSCYMSGYGVERDEKKAIQYFEICVEEKEPEGTYRLAEYYNKKSDLKSMEKAAKLYDLAAKEGHTEAKSHLGICYFEGKGVNQNDKFAYDWLYQSVIDEGDYFWGGYYLALCYLQGRGTELNERYGFDILKRSVDIGCSRFSQACELLAECYQNGTGTVKNRKLMLHYREKGQRSDRLISELAETIN